MSSTEIGWSGLRFVVCSVVRFRASRFVVEEENTDRFVISWELTFETTPV